MIPLTQVRDLVVVPALEAIGHAEPAAVRLVIGTGLIESQYAYLSQIGGPALGFWQMEPATLSDCFVNYLAFNSSLQSQVLSLLIPYETRQNQLAWNMQFGAAMCRIKYLRSPIPLPAADDLVGLAGMYKTVYNSDLGAATAEKFMQLANQFGLMDI